MYRQLFAKANKVKAVPDIRIGYTGCQTKGPYNNKKKEKSSNCIKICKSTWLVFYRTVVEVIRGKMVL